MPRTADIRITVNASRYEEAVALLESAALELTKIDFVLSARLRPGIEDGVDEFAALKDAAQPTDEANAESLTKTPTAPPNEGGA